MHAHNQAENLLKMCLFLGKGEFLKKILKQTITNAWKLKKKEFNKKNVYKANFNNSKKQHSDAKIKLRI